MGVSGTTTATTTIPSYEPLRRDSFRPPSLEAADNSLGLASSLSPVEEQVSTHLFFYILCKVLFIYNSHLKFPL